MSARIRSGLILGLGLLFAIAAAGADEPKTESPATPDHGVTALLEEIRGRQAALDRRERELDDRERRVAELEQLSLDRLSELKDIQRIVEDRIAEWQEASGDTIRRLAKIYAAMPPPQAAGLMEDLEVELATQIVSKMKHKESAAVLSLVSRERALAMSRKVAHPLGMKPVTRVPTGGSQ